MISPRILKNGKTVYDVSIYTDGQKRTSKTAYTLADARALEVSMLAERNVRNGKSADMTLRQYIEHHYWPVAVKRLAVTSIETYEAEIRLRLLPNLGETPLLSISRRDVQSMVDTCATRSVAKSAVGVLKTILNEAIADDYITHNPACATLALPKDGQRRDNGLVLQNFAQISAFLRKIRESGSNCVQRIAYLGFLQGLRPEERYALDWLSFDMHARTITISAAYVTASSRNGGNQLKPTKTKNSMRVIPMHADFAEWLESQPSGHGAFIVGANGQRISPSTARKRWNRFLMDNPECPPVTIENMRHSFATAYLAAGGRIEVLSRILGHANIQTTIDRYYRPDVSILRADMDNITDAQQIARCFPRSNGYNGKFDSPRLHHL